MKNMQDFHALTEDKLVLKKKIKDGEGDFAKDNQEVEGRFIINLSTLYRKIWERWYIRLNKRQRNFQISLGS